MDDLGAVLRAGRRTADVSQRQLAARAGVPHSLVARLETERHGLVDLPRLGAVLAALGLRLVVVDAQGCPVQAEPPGQPRDRGGRRFPPHLDLRKVHEHGWNWWGWLRYSTWSYPPQPDYTFDLDRAARDVWRERAKDAEPGRLGQPNQDGDDDEQPRPGEDPGP